MFAGLALWWMLVAVTALLDVWADGSLLVAGLFALTFYAAMKGGAVRNWVLVRLRLTKPKRGPGL